MVAGKRRAPFFQNRVQLTCVDLRLQVIARQIAKPDPIDGCLSYESDVVDDELAFDTHVHGPAVAFEIPDGIASPGLMAQIDAIVLGQVVWRVRRTMLGEICW